VFGVGAGSYSIGEVAVCKRLMENKFGFNEHCDFGLKGFTFLSQNFLGD